MNVDVNISLVINLCLYVTSTATRLVEWFSASAVMMHSMRYVAYGGYECPESGNVTGHRRCQGDDKHYITLWNNKPVRGVRERVRHLLKGQHTAIIVRPRHHPQEMTGTMSVVRDLRW